MECFNNLLLKLREVHEREVEGWQMKIQELSNKKGCDTKRMEELFSKNQQMKEQQRLLTENIKTLENRLRAGLCDRCTVTQEVAKRRQQEFEGAQIQSLQHISLMAGEMNNLKKENRRLRDDIRNLRLVLKSHSDHSSKSNITTEVKPNSSPDLSPSSGPAALVSTATSRAGYQPADGDVAVKTEADQRTEETEHRHLREMNRSHFGSYTSLSLSTLQPPSWKTERSVTRVGERRAQSVEGLDQRSSISPQEVNPSRHVLHVPVPCRPQPIKSSPVTLSWPLSESSDWVAAASAGSSLVVQSNLPRFPNLVPTSQPASPRRQVFASPWHKQSTPLPATKEPTVLFRLSSLPEQVQSQIQYPEKKESPPSKAERVSEEGLREAYEGPLDLSDRGKSTSSQTPRDDSPLDLQGGERVERSPDKNVKTNPSAHDPGSSPSPAVPPSSSSTLQQEEEPTSDHNHKQVMKEQEQKEEVNGKIDKNGKKVPVLTISLRPVVVLENLNSTLQKQQSSNGKSSSQAVELESSSEEQDKEETAPGQENDQGCKRKRASVETETDRDWDIDNAQQARKIKITLRPEKKSPS